MSPSLITLLLSFSNPSLTAVPSGPSPSWSSSATQPSANGGRSTAANRLPLHQITERVALIELNHFYDDQGRHAYDQVVFYEWSPDYRRVHVVHWHLINKDASRVPQYDPGRKEYYSQWVDRDACVRRTVRAKSFQETWSQTDPERDNRRVFDEKYRVSLLPATKNKFH